MRHKFTFFILLVVVVTLLPDVVICGFYFSSWPVWAQWVYVLTIVWSVFAVVVMQTWLLGRMLSVRFFFTTFLFVITPKLLFAFLAPLFGYLAGLTTALLFVVAAVYGSLWGWRRLVVTHDECVSPTLPNGFDGYRIVQLSDLHLGSLARHSDFIEHIVETVKAQHPDLIVFTGDLVNQYVNEAIPFADTLGRLSAPDGVIAILGNHDHVDKSHFKQLLSLMNDMGWFLLMDGNVMLRRGEDSIAVAGVDVVSPSPFWSKGDLQKALHGIPSGIWTMLLSHDPSHWRHEVLGKSDVALTLSGHTHGAHIRLLGFSPARLMYREWGGTYHEGERMLHVSLGISGTVCFRLGAWPEVNVITLRKG